MCDELNSNAKTIRDVYIELPKQDSHSGRDDMVGKSKFCWYGTRDAVLNWQKISTQHLIDRGFVRRIGFRSVFVDKAKDICTLVHGDDDRSTGSSASLPWISTAPPKRYEIKTRRVGIDEVCMREGHILNRVVTATNKEVEMEADQTGTHTRKRQTG